MPCSTQSHDSSAIARQNLNLGCWLSQWFSTFHQTQPTLGTLSLSQEALPELNKLGHSFNSLAQFDSLPSNCSHSGDACLVLEIRVPVCKPYTGSSTFRKPTICVCTTTLQQRKLHFLEYLVSCF